MAKRASEKSFFGLDDEGGVSGEGEAGMDGASGGGEGGGGWGWGGSGRDAVGGWIGGKEGGGGGGGGGGETFAPRKSFVAKRGWGSMKMVEVRWGGCEGGGGGHHVGIAFFCLTMSVCVLCCQEASIYILREGEVVFTALVQTIVGL